MTSAIERAARALLIENRVVLALHNLTREATERLAAAAVRGFLSEDEEMVERVARALWDSHTIRGGGLHTNARAAIAALREMATSEESK